MYDECPLLFFQDRKPPQSKGSYPHQYYYSGYKQKIDEKLAS